MPADISALAEIDLFRSLPIRETQTILSRLQSRWMKDNDVILRQGDQADALYIINSGIVSVTVQDREDVHELDRLGRGECVGEMSLMTGQPCSATVTALTDTEVLTLSRADFTAVLDSCPGLWRNLSRILSQRLVRTNRRLAAHPTGNVAAIAVLGDADEATMLAASLIASLASQSQRKTVLIDWRQDPRPASVLPETARVPSLGDILQDRALLQEHDRPLDRDNGLLGASFTTVAGSSEGRIPTEPEALTVWEWLRPFHSDIVLLLSLNDNPPPAKLLEQVGPFIIVIPEGEISSAPSLLPLTPPWAERLRGLQSEGKLEAAVVASRPLPTLVHRQLEQRIGRRIRHRLPDDRAAITKALAEKRPFTISDPQGQLSLAVARLARHVGGLEIGLALGAGAAKGFAHIGVLKVFEEEGIPVDCIAGCSIGAIVGALYAGGFPLADIERMMHGTDKRVTRWTIPYSSILSDAGLKAVLREAGPNVHFHQLDIPFATVATHLVSGRQVVIQDGLVWRAVQASVSIPGIFPPTVIGRLHLMDGGMVNPVPSQVVRDMGASIAVAVDLMSPITPQPPRADDSRSVPKRRRSFNLVEILLRTREIMQGEIAIRSVAGADVTIRPAVESSRLSDFSNRGQEFIAAGEAAARAALPELQPLLPWSSGQR